MFVWRTASSFSPGGPGTAEELLYILGIMMHPNNADQPMPIVLTGSKESEAYFRSIDKFIVRH
ncbi:LOG family protein [Vibrio chagasii]|nr:LOG family protein [Vibrio chagasii]